MRQQNQFGNIKTSLQNCGCLSQAAALEILLTKQNTLISGVAGAGKTTLIREFINTCLENNLNIGITASTGIAATLLNGQTIHSFFGFGISKDPFNPQAIPDSIRKQAPKIRQLDVLIIDEISMVSALLLDKINACMRFFRHDTRPFGGCQIVLVGDFSQLPPVGDGEDGTPCYQSKTWRDTQITPVFLDKPIRAKDPQLANILENIAQGQGDNQQTRQLLAPRLDTTPPGNKTIIRLYSTNRNVEKINRLKQQNNPGTEQAFPLAVLQENTTGEIQRMKHNHRLTDVTTLRVGDPVMVTMNLAPSETKCDDVIPNGALGKITGFTATPSGWPVAAIDFNSHGTLQIGYHEYRSIEHIPVYNPDTEEYEIKENLKASLLAIPLRLAYAATIHKSQGQTFDGVRLSFRNCFTKGLGYVALSRVAAIKDLYIEDKTIPPKALQVDENSIKIAETIRDTSSRLRQRILATPDLESFMPTAACYQQLAATPATA